MLDRYLEGEVARISPEAPVPVVAFERDEFRAGGAANVALNLAAQPGFNGARSFSISGHTQRDHRKEAESETEQEDFGSNAHERQMSDVSYQIRLGIQFSLDVYG